MLCLLVTGGWLGVIAADATAAPAPAKSTEPPVTECFESREGYTTVTRVENAVPQYGYPNVKCSNRTSKVWWYGDPYDGTIPMGDMPVLAADDPTRGDFANAVVKPREPHLMYFNMDPEKHCAACHDGQTVPFPKSNKPRELGMHQDIVEDSLQLQHGRGAIWCLDCHNATDRNSLKDRQGAKVSFNQPQKLCGSCHGQVYANWRMGIHGKRIGSWKTGGKKRWWVCTECHNPHTVQKARFDPIKPEAAPELPRGMKNADHERTEHGGN
ncbi:hypothetical protein [Ferrigenium sp. UT5]|uniref:hypothetical protein n=1 Tax=Ferrigenium sp. UT5 TaxID=3242105 RepID=UPI0038B39A24